MSENTDIDQWNRDELYTLASVADLSGRSSMSKAELFSSLEDSAPELLDPFTDVQEVAEGDAVEMNHLKSVLTVSCVDETDTHTEVVLVTNRGGRHKLVVPDDGEEVGKNGSSPHLERWRAGDQEWMNNSTDPVYFLKISSETDSSSEESDNE